MGLKTNITLSVIILGLIIGIIVVAVLDKKKINDLQKNRDELEKNRDDLNISLQKTKDDSNIALQASKDLLAIAERTKNEEDIKKALEAKKISDELLAKIQKLGQDLTTELAKIQKLEQDLATELAKLKIGDTISYKRNILVPINLKYIVNTNIYNSYMKYDVVINGTVINTTPLQVTPYSVKVDKKINIIDKDTNLGSDFSFVDTMAFTKLATPDIKVGDRISFDYFTKNQPSLCMDVNNEGILILSGIVENISSNYITTIKWDKITNNNPTYGGSVSTNTPCIFSKAINPTPEQDTWNKNVFDNPFNFKVATGQLAKQTVVSRVLGKFKKFF